MKKPLARLVENRGRWQWVATVRLDAFLAMAGIDQGEQPAQETAPAAAPAGRLRGAGTDRFVFVATGGRIDQLVECNRHTLAAGRAEQDQPGKAQHGEQATEQTWQEQQEQQQALFHAKPPNCRHEKAPTGGAARCPALSPGRLHHIGVCGGVFLIESRCHIDSENLGERVRPFD